MLYFIFNGNIMLIFKNHQLAALFITAKDNNPKMETRKLAN